MENNNPGNQNKEFEKEITSGFIPTQSSIPSPPLFSESPQSLDDVFYKRLDKIIPEGVPGREPQAVVRQAQFGVGEFLVYQTHPWVARTPLLYLHPTLDPIYFIVPRERIDDANRIYRHYYETHPLVGNAIDLHCELPLSDFTLEVEDPQIYNYYNDFKERIKLLDFLYLLLREYWITGEAFAWGQWDPISFEWIDFPIIPGENITIYGSYISSQNLHFLKPDPNLQRLLQSGDLKERELVKFWDPQYVKALKKGQEYFLDSKRLIILQRKTSSASLRGTSILKRVLKDLMYEDKLKYLQLTFIDRHAFPLKIFKLGSEAAKWIPSPKHFAQFRALLAQACFSEDTEILTENGFKNYWEIKEGEKIATVNPETLEVEYRPYTNFFLYNFPHNGGDSNFVKRIIPDISLILKVKRIAETIYKQEVEKTVNLSILKDVPTIPNYYVQLFLSEYFKLKGIEFNNNDNDYDIQEAQVYDERLAEYIAVALQLIGYESRVLKPGNTDLHLIQWRKQIVDKMIQIKTQSLDLLVTPNHYLFVKNLNSSRIGGFDGKWEKVMARDLKRMSQFLSVPKFNSNGQEINEEIQIGRYKINLKDLCELVGYYISEGWLVHKDNHIEISQSEKSTLFIQKMDALIKRLPFSFRKVRADRKSRIRDKEYFFKGFAYKLKEPEIVSFLSSECGENSRSKRIPIKLKNLPKEYLQILLDALLLGDGTKFKSKMISRRSEKTYSYEYERYRFYTSSPQLCRDIQEICLKLGWSSMARLRKTKTIEKLPAWIIHLAPPRKIKKNACPLVYKESQIQKVPYEGKVFCFEVPPYHTLITRHNGRIVVTYQSNDPDFTFYSKVEILTKDGWKNGETIERSDKVFCMDPETGKTFYRVPSAWKKVEYCGKMYRFKNDFIDLMVTPKHRMWVKVGKSWGFMLAKDLYELDGFVYMVSPKIEKNEIVLFREIRIDCKKDIQEVDFEGEIYCPIINPRFLVVARGLDGREILTGQSIIYHFGLEVDYVTPKDKIMDLKPEFDFFDKRILTGLFVHEDMLRGAVGGWFERTINIRLLFHRYMRLRDALANEIILKIFYPLARARGYKKRTTAEIKHKVYVKGKEQDYIDKLMNLNPRKALGEAYHEFYLPRIQWQVMNLLSNIEEQRFVQALYEKGVIPFEFVCELFGWRKEYIEKLLRKEEGTPFDSVYRDSRRAVLSKPELAKEVLKGKKTKEIIEEMEKEERLKEWQKYYEEERKKREKEREKEKMERERIKETLPEVPEQVSPIVKPPIEIKPRLEIPERPILRKPEIPEIREKPILEKPEIPEAEVPIPEIPPLEEKPKEEAPPFIEEGPKEGV